MNVVAISVSILLGLAATASAQDTPKGKPAGQSAASKGQLSEVRSLVHELEARSEKLLDLMTQYRSLVEQRPQPQGGSPDAKKAHEDQLASWSGAVERLLRRIDAARAAVVEAMQRLDQAATQQLPTTLAKDVANARNQAEAQRAAAEQALAKNKSAPARTAKPAKKAPAADAPTLPDDV
jgi:DNA repair exonuclease SbcCD ATPase subunit